MSKLIVILGITGNQGGSVAKTFAKDPEYKIRGVTRGLTKPESQALIAQGVELVRGDFDDISSLKKAFEGAHTIFANTAFNPAWVTRPNAVAKQLKPGQTFREWCYETELRQGKNVADAVATVSTLELFIWSTLSSAKRWSKGKYSGVYHFEAKADIEEYIKKRCPAVARKMSLLQMGLYVTNWRRGKASQLWQKRSDGSLILKVPGAGNVPIPLVIPADTGEYAKALTKLPRGTNLLAYSDLILWEDFAKLWSKVTGVPVSFEHATIDDMDREGPGGYGIQIGEMLAYSQDFGYWGGDPSVIFTKDVKFDIPVTSLEEFIRSEDWSRLIDGPADIN